MHSPNLLPPLAVKLYVGCKYRFEVHSLPPLYQHDELREAGTSRVAGEGVGAKSAMFLFAFCPSRL